MALLRGVLPWEPGWRVLDVGCGAGRHARALASAGGRPVGLDLSAALLRRARATGLPVVRADMRALPIRDGTVDLAVNLFTSFGYFQRDEHHAAVLRGISACLAPGGWFALDFLNAERVRRTLVAEEVQHLGECQALVTRTLEDGGRRVVKSIQVSGGRTFTERVRLFSSAELEAMLAAAGLQVEFRFGDYDGSPPDPAAPRVLLLSRRLH